MTELFDDLHARGISWLMRSDMGGVFVELSHDGRIVASKHGPSAYEALIRAMLVLRWHEYQVRRAA